MRAKRKWATDHRAVVLEEVATHPGVATDRSIIKACSTDNFPTQAVGSMIWILRKEGLIARGDDGGNFITRAGLDWLTTGRFDRALPAPHERPNARGRKK